LIAPGSGFLIGLLLGGIGEMVTGSHILLGFAVPLGTVVGFIFGCAVAIPFSGLPYFTILKYLGTGTLALSVPCAFLGEAGPAFAMISGLVGFWVGAAMLAIDLCRGRLESAAAVQKATLAANG
jgi:hypothetical protein